MATISQTTASFVQATIAPNLDVQDGDSTAQSMTFGVFGVVVGVVGIVLGEKLCLSWLDGQWFLYHGSRALGPNLCMGVHWSLMLLDREGHHYPAFG